MKQVSTDSAAYKKIHLLLHHICVSEISTAYLSWIFWPRSSKTKVEVPNGVLLWEVLRKNGLPRSFWLTADFSSLQLVEWGPTSFLAVSWREPLGPRSVSLVFTSGTTSLGPHMGNFSDFPFCSISFCFEPENVLGFFRALVNKLGDSG